MSVADAAFVEDHESVEYPAFSICVGFAESVHAGGGTLTVTRVSHVRTPAGPATVSENVREDVMFETAREPFTLTGPMF